MKVTHLIIFVPPVLGAYVLSHHPSQGTTLTTPSDQQVAQGEGTTVRINQSAHFSLPIVLDNQAEHLMHNSLIPHLPYPQGLWVSVDA